MYESRSPEVKKNQHLTAPTYNRRDGTNGKVSIAFHNIVTKPDLQFEAAYCGKLQTSNLI